MSRFLKFIVHLVVICTVACIAAIMVPPFFGITTVVMDDPEIKTNLPMGSVTYAIPVKTEEVAVGTKILVEEDGKTYRYNIVSKNLEERTGTVADPTISGSETLTVAFKNYVPKVVITVGMLGYLQVATKSMEGLIILALLVVVLIILFVLAELWKKEPETPEGEEDDEVYVKSEKELRREEKEREKRMKEEDKRLLKEAKEKKKQERKNKNIIKTGGFVGEVFEDELEGDDEQENKVSASDNAQFAASEAHELLKKEIAATTAEDNEAPAVKKSAKPVRQKSAKPAEIKKMAIPKYTVEQLAEKARRAGDDPEVLKDPVTEVTMFDYSDIIGD
ncbi:MAG: hypothetical protein KBT01_03940 [Clostridiales bacterium]|nr:hypothetical protein [Candidatus Blautia equi]